MDENKKVFFIVNKYSGGGYRDSLEGKIIQACERLGLECTIEFTRERGHAIELAQQAVQEKFPYAFAVGGDGTINETAQGLLGSETALGILPKGSGNGLARHLGIPLGVEKALTLLDQHEAVWIDTFRINDYLSVNVSGIGFDGHIAGLFGEDGIRGLVGYARLVMKEFVSYREFHAELILDGQKIDCDNFIVAIANASQFGNNAKVAPHASVRDNWLDVAMIQKVKPLNAVVFASQLFSGKLNRSPFVRLVKAKHIDISVAQPVAFHVDGEGLKALQKFTIRIQPASLKVLVPLHCQI